SRYLGDWQRVIDHFPGGLLLELRSISFSSSRHSIPFLSRRILLDPLSGNGGAPHGVAVLAVTAVGAALGWNSTGLWILGIFGVICLLMALIAHRLRNITVEHGETKIGFTLDAEVRKDLEVTGLTGASGTYFFIHNQLAKDPDLAEVKIKLQDQVVEMVQANAFSDPVGQDQVEQVLKSGSPAERVLVFGLLQKDGTLVTVERLRKGIRESRS